MKVAILAGFALLLLLTVQRAASTPLAYFAFFPLGALTLFYFSHSKDWLLFSVALGALGTAYFFSHLGPFFQENVGLWGIALGSLGALIYHEQVLEKILRNEGERLERARSELSDLKVKQLTRLESLRHLEKQVASLINLFEIARDFNEGLDFKETAQILFKKVLPEISFDRAELVLLTQDPHPLTLSKVYAISKQGVEEKEEIEARAIEREWLEKALQEKDFVSWDDTWLFPLILEGNFIGLFAVQGSDRQDLAKFEVLASQLALQVRKVNLYETVRELAIIDGLTGVYVRRHFLERFEEEIRRALKHNFALSVIMLDIDHFKRYNDEFGHLVGDATLKEVSRLIRANVRTVDIVARYGGEEFVIVIPETREEGAREVAERIRSAIARHEIRIYDEHTKVTVSIGISVFPQDLALAASSGYDAGFLFELLQKADRALYRAKEEGRNRVVVHRSLGTS